MNRYPNIFSQCKIGKTTLKNRIIMAPTGTALASSSGEITDHFVAYYKARAKGGAGLIVVEVTPVDYITGRSGPIGPRADSVKYQYGWQRLADAVHPYGAKIIAQLQHPGNQTMELFNDGNKLLSPSGVKCLVQPDTPREMSNAEIYEMIQKFISAAVMLRDAGLDGVEIHGAHGYLVNQFFSSHTNRRDDEFGGSFENRMRFAAKIIDGIRKACGECFIISIRLTLDEHTAYGFGLEEGVRIAKYCAGLGVDLISASNGTYETMETNLESPGYEQGWRIYLAEAVKQVVDIPVAGVGVLREPQIIEDILAAGRCDLAAIGRGWMAEPEWVEKVRTNREDELRKCTSCCHCFDQLNKNRIVTCALNPEKGHEFEYGALRLTGEGKTVIVIGGGPGGMEAARVLSMRKFKVILFEKAEKLGGQLLPASKPIGKEKIEWVVEYGETMLKILGVDIRLNTEATLDGIRREDPYAVFIATGGTPDTTSIIGAEQPHVKSAAQWLMEQPDVAGKTVCVVGGGMTGCETAVTIAASGGHVTIIEMLDEICGDAFIVNKIAVMQNIEKYGVKVMAGYKTIKIGKTDLILETEKRERLSVPAETVILSLGTNPVNDLFDGVSKFCNRTFILGDAVTPGTIADATGAAHVLAREVS